MRISYLGPIGTFSHQAVTNYISDNNSVSYELLPCKTITEAILMLISSDADISIVPIENSIQGSVFETIDTLFENENLTILKDFILEVNQNLLSNFKKNEIQKIYSHPQGIAQCRNYINKNFSNIDIIETASTASAAEIAKNTLNSACICNLSCAKEYSLNILDENIQDSDKNKTRFIVLSKNNIENKNCTKTSIYFSTLNKPGELYKILGLFNIFNVNLTKIESRPAKTALGEYVFWIDFESSPNNKSIPILLEQIKTMCSYFRILGSY